MVNIKDLKGHKGVDIDEFDGVSTKIADVSISKPTTIEYNGKSQEVINLIIETENLSGDEKVQVKAREYIRLYEKDGELGYSQGKNSKAQKVLNYFKVSDFEQLKGLGCTAVKRVQSNDREFLGIHHG